MLKVVLIVVLGIAPGVLMRSERTYPTLEAAIVAVDATEYAGTCPPDRPPYALATELSPGRYGAPYRVRCGDVD